MLNPPAGRHRPRCVGLGLCWAVGTPVLAQAAPPADGRSDVVVVGTRAKALHTDVAAALHLDADAMRATGATSIADLVKRIGARAQAANGSAPILAIDGRRPLGDEIDTLPFEAFQSTDVLPPEAAVTLGYPPTRPVINLVTKARFRAVETRANGSTAT